MINIKFQIRVDERLCKDCKNAAQQTSLVRGHFRVINGKKVYVKAHYRKK